MIYNEQVAKTFEVYYTGDTCASIKAYWWLVEEGYMRDFNIGQYKQDSKRRMKFSKQLEIIDVSGPYRHYLWRHMGFRVQVMVKSHLKGDGRIQIYYQDYETWGFAFVRVVQYHIYKWYHNFKHRRHQR